MKKIFSVRSTIIVAVFSMVSFLLSLIKFGGASSIALDSFPSYFTAVYFHPILGGLVALIGHLLSAASGGFPFSLQVHLLIALLQAIWAIVFGIIPRIQNKIYLLSIAAPIAILLNGYAAPYIIGYFFPELKDPIIGLIPVLLIASTVNIIVTIIALVTIKNIPTSRG